jgi:hypothetical protein
MTMKTAVWAATVAFVCSVGVAAAQNTPTPSPQAVSPDEMRAILQKLAQQRANTNANANGVQSGTYNYPPLVVGWNFAHATNCGWFFDGTNQWFYIFPSEGGIVYTLNNLYTSQGLQISCSDGNWFGWHVLNTSTGAYDQTISYTFK